MAKTQAVRRVQLPIDVGPDVAGLVCGGLVRHLAEEAEVESTKQGVMRGGSQGVYIPNGMSAGQCHRAAHARMLGGIEPRTPKEQEERLRKQWMFDSGHANEDTWFRNLGLSEWRGPILREEELPITWTIDGVRGSGREDIILCHESPPDGALGMIAADGRTVYPALALELKQISSINTAMEVMFEGGMPKLENAAQIGRYMHELECPGQLWYTNPFVIPIPDWSFLELDRIPRLAAELDYECIERGRGGKPSKIGPAIVGYHMAWHDGVLHFCRVGREADGWTPTIITLESLDDFWRMAVDTPNIPGMGPRPVALDALGQPKTYSPCSYCQWSKICDKAEDDYSKWRQLVLATRTGSSKQKQGD